MNSVAIFAPAKLNLFLAVTGRRPDGFHDLLSLTVPVEWGDRLKIETAGADGEFSLACDDPAVPCDETNLVLKAAHLFRDATDWRGGAKFFLEKRIPMGAGLGGGSSDGVAALRGLNQLAGAPLRPAELETLAGRLGSDCALFLHDGPVLLRGRGERTTGLDRAVTSRLSGRRVLIFKPAFGIATAWAYAQMAAISWNYLPLPEAEARLAAWLDDPCAPTEALFFNNMEAVAFAKFAALPALLEKLRRDFGLAPRMSGSGSACFVLLSDGAPVAEITRTVRAAWGESACVVETRLM